MVFKESCIYNVHVANYSHEILLDASKQRVETSELKWTYRDCRKGTGNKLEYWYT